ncbi:MAG: HsdM family class I SAM-dependent methyltransferase [Candidatus Dormibacteria bacterium]
MGEQGEAARGQPAQPHRHLRLHGPLAEPCRQRRPGAAYEYLLKQFADQSGAKAGEFFTPRAVVRLLSRLLEAQPTDSVYDPACGSGGMLIEAANEVIESGGSLRQMRFYGQEVSLTTAAIARMNLYLHDIEDAKVLRGDTLREPKFRDAQGRLERFNVVIANPPFSLKKWGAESWAADPWGRSACGVPPKTNGDYVRSAASCARCSVTASCRRRATCSIERMPISGSTTERASDWRSVDSQAGSQNGWP